MILPRNSPPNPLTCLGIPCYNTKHREQDSNERGKAMIEQLKQLGFNDKAAAFLAAEIAAGRKTFAKIEFGAQMNLNYVAKINAEHAN